MSRIAHRAVPMCMLPGVRATKISSQRVVGGLPCCSGAARPRASSACGRTRGWCAPRRWHDVGAGHGFEELTGHVIGHAGREAPEHAAHGLAGTRPRPMAEADPKRREAEQLGEVFGRTLAEETIELFSGGITAEEAEATAEVLCAVAP